MHGSTTIIKRRLVDHYDRDAARYHAVNYTRPDSYAPLRYRQFYVERMLDRLPIPDGASILDVGCGPGELVVSLLRQGYDARGVDISAGMVAEATRVLADHGLPSTGRISLGDIERLEFADRSLDVVVAAGVLEYQHDDDKALSEMHRVLKPGGYLILNVTNRYAYLGMLDGTYRWLKKHGVTRRLLQFLKDTLLRKGALHDLPDRRTHTPGAFDRTLTAFGFKKLAHNYFHFSPLPAPLDSVFPALCRPAGQWLERLTDHPLGRVLGGGYLVTATKVRPTLVSEPRGR